MSARTATQSWDVSEPVLADPRRRTLRTDVLDAVDAPNTDRYANVLDLAVRYPHHRYLLTTANPVEVLTHVRDAKLPDEVDVWVGMEVTDVESARIAASFIDILDTEKVFLHIPRLSGLPCEDMLRNIARGKPWVILGAADNPTPMHPEWVRVLRDHCVLHGGALRFENWGQWVENAVVSQDEYVVRVPRTVSRAHCAMHISGRIALCPSNPHNPFLQNEPGWTVLRRAAKDDPARELLDGKVWSEEPFLSDEPDVPEDIAFLDALDEWDDADNGLLAI